MPSRRFSLACLGLVGTFGIAGIAIALNLFSQLSSAQLALPATPTESTTPVPTKFAIAVATASPTPSNTPTATPTLKPTATRAPTRTPTATSTARPSSSPTTTPSPTPTSVSVGEKYGTLAVYPSPSDHSTALVELSLAARGFAPSNGTLGLMNTDGPADEGAPQLYSLFADERTPIFTAAYQVNDWDWNCDCRSTASGYEITLVGFAVTPGEILRVPRSSYYLGNDYQALVVYADRDRITFNYTRTGNPVRGYTIYLENVAVDSNLYALYQQTHSAGHAELPALQAGQGIGLAKGSEIQVAVRDAGAFMDPRSRKDWWRGR
jgi:hypothetical protein